jgi:hypothetical protein
MTNKTSMNGCKYPHRRCVGVGVMAVSPFKSVAGPTSITTHIKNLQIPRSFSVTSLYSHLKFKVNTGPAAVLAPPIAEAPPTAANHEDECANFSGMNQSNRCVGIATCIQFNACWALQSFSARVIFYRLGPNWQKE